MEVAEHVERIRADGAALRDAAEVAGPDAPVPSCPDWTVRDLVRHVGMVHRWAAAQVRDALPAERPESETTGPWPADADLFRWFADGHQALVGTLAAAPADVACWHFLPAPSPLAFWARRQAHETGIHRADADLAAGRRPEFPPEFAADGIDELVTGFAARRSSPLRDGPPGMLAVEAVDAGRRWPVPIGTDPGDRAPDCVVRGSASDLYLALWNRGDLAALRAGDDPAGLVDRWQRSVTVRWTR